MEEPIEFIFPEDWCDKPAELPNLRWHIDVDKADETKQDIGALSLIEVDSNNVLLQIDIAKIPVGFSIEEYLRNISNAGLVFADSSLKNQ